MKQRLQFLLVAGLLGTAGILSVARGQDGSWGNVSGRILWDKGKEIPAQMPLDLKANADKAVCEKAGKLLEETWVVNAKNRGLQHTFVWLDPVNKGDKIPIHPSLKKVTPEKVDMDQPVCQFIPHAQGLREGQILVAKNSSPIAHNYKWQGNPAVNAGGNVLLPPGATKEIADLAADRLPVSIECNIHPWMKGWVRVYNHPYFAVTDADGKFALKNAPAGEFRLKIWHGSGGWAGGAKGKDGRPITIKTGDNDQGDIEYPAP